MKKTLPQIADSELLIMKELWKKSPLMNRDIVRIISEKSQWSNKTIETLLRRLVDKKAVGYRQGESKVREYYPLINEEEYMEAESETFLEKVYNGSISMLISGFIKHKKISEEELNKLKELIDNNDN